MFHKAYKLSIVTEKLWAEKICKAITQFGGKGYTILPAGGKGIHHYHSLEDKALLVDDFGEVLISVIMHSQDKARELGENIYQKFFSSGPGILYLEEVAVIRSERF